MVGVCRKCSRMAPIFTQHRTLSSRRCARCRRVDGSGKRDGSLQCGAACSAQSPAAIRSQACCRQRKLRCADGASQSGKTVKLFLHGRQIPRRTQMCSRRSSWAWRSRRPWPMIVSSWQTGHRRGRRSNGTTPDRGCLSSQAVRYGENHGWREGPPPVLPARIDPATGLHPPGVFGVERIKNTAF